MDVNGRGCSSGIIESEDEIMDLRRGPWTVDEDLVLMNYIADHGEGRWNSLAQSAGLKRTGKSCRLRWLNYLRPDVRRGNITLEEQLLILELHSHWGNRWSKIAQYMPGRTDNEIKNYWRTRVQKHAKQLKCDVNSKKFKDTMRYLWIPRLVERIQASATAAAPNSAAATDTSRITDVNNCHHFNNSSDNIDVGLPHGNMTIPTPAMSNGGSHVTTAHESYTPENSSTAASSDSFAAQVSPISDITAEYYGVPTVVNDNNQECFYQTSQASYSDSLTSPFGFFSQGLDFQTTDLIQQESPWFQGGDVQENLWNVDDMLFLQQQLHGSI